MGRRILRKLLMALAALAFSGCAGGGLQIGTATNVQNDCAPVLDVERPGGVFVEKRIPYSHSALVKLVSMPLSGYSRCMSLVVKGYTEQREYLGSMTREFCVNTYDGSREAWWTVTDIRYPPTGENGCHVWRKPRQTPQSPPQPPPPGPPSNYKWGEGL